MQTLITVHALIQYEDKYLVLKRSAHRSNPGYWNCVTGHIKEYESGEETAIREVKEETNLEGTIVKTAEPFVHMAGERRWIIFAYLVHVEDISNLKIDSNESEEYRWITKEDQMIKEYKGMEDTFKLLGILS
ncbi:MAG TPA: NUDIX hydrolase [Candidatus Dojkabacteria bacterium]|nr:NUDIX hydrolase [Candidatus Dojkabacteria bacterium]